MTVALRPLSSPIGVDRVGARLLRGARAARSSCRHQLLPMEPDRLGHRRAQAGRRRPHRRAPAIRAACADPRTSQVLRDALAAPRRGRAWRRRSRRSGWPCGPGLQCACARSRRRRSRAPAGRRGNRPTRSWLAREADQRHAGALGGRHRERGRRRDRGQQRHAGHRGLLHHLEAGAAGDGDEAAGGVDARAWPARRSACRARCGGRRPRAAMAPRPSAVHQAAACTAPVACCRVCRSANCAIARLIAARAPRRRADRLQRTAGARRPGRGSRCRRGRSRCGRSSVRRRSLSRAKAPLATSQVQRDAERRSAPPRPHRARAARPGCLRSARSRARSPPGRAAWPASPRARCRCIRAPPAPRRPASPAWRTRGRRARRAPAARSRLRRN